MSTLFRILIGFTIASILFSCSVARRALPPPADYSRAVATPLPMSLGVPVDSLVPTRMPRKPTPALVQKHGVLGVFGKKKTASSTETPFMAGAETHTNATQMPRKCKGCVFNLGSGNLSVAGKKAQAATGTGAALTVAGKKGQAAKADSGGFVGQATAKQQAAAGKDLQQTDTTPHKSIGATIAENLTKPLGIVLALVVVAVGASGIWWLVGWIRRGKKAADTIA